MMVKMQRNESLLLDRLTRDFDMDLSMETTNSPEMSVEMAQLKKFLESLCVAAFQGSSQFRYLQDILIMPRSIQSTIYHVLKQHQDLCLSCCVNSICECNLESN